MSAPGFGPWEPLSLEAAVATFSGAPFRWWISGGHALELHLQRSWREHEDIDIGVLRSDLAAVYTKLHDWDVHVAAAGELQRWGGEPLDLDRHRNNLWSRFTANGPWVLDITIGEGTADVWIYRRDTSVRIPWDRAVLYTSTGIPYLAPELQMLYKSNGRRPKDNVDAAEVVPTLNLQQQEFLATQLGPTHPWSHLFA